MIRDLLHRFFATWLNLVPPSPAAPDIPETRRRGISPEALARARMKPGAVEVAQQAERYVPPKGVVPDAMRGAALAMDSTDYDYVNQSGIVGGFFRGYPYLATLTQRPEYRKMCETIAKEMCRKWITFKSKGDGEDKADKIALIEAAFEKYKVRAAFAKAALLDAQFGRGQIFIDVAKPGTSVSSRDERDELRTILIRDKAKIAKGALLGLRAVEPVWTYPSSYNSTDPLSPDYYTPSAWFVMGKEVHRSRMLTFISRPMPDMLKPSYNFGGVSLSQLAEPYIENWLRTRDSVSDLVHSYSLTGIATDMSSVLGGGDGANMFDRADMYNQIRDNRGLFLVDKDVEEFFQFNTPLSGLDALQAQAQEQMSSVSSIPLVKLLGITPSGLNASSDGEIRVFYDWIHSEQDALFRDNLQHVSEIIQLSELGEIDPDITFDFVQLWEMDESETAANRKIAADIDAVLIGSGVIMPDEARARIVADPGSGYDGLELNNPDLPDPDDEDDPDDDGPGPKTAADEFSEADHPRDSGGKFGAGGSSPKFKAGARSDNIRAAQAMLTSMGHRSTSDFKLGGEVARATGTGPGSTINLNSGSEHWMNPGHASRKSHAAGLTSSPHPAHAVYHEAAHASMAFPDHERDFADGEHEAARTVSKYAGENRNEFIAEYVAGRRAGIKFTPEADALYDHLAGKLSPRTAADAGFVEADHPRDAGGKFGSGGGGSKADATPPKKLSDDHPLLHPSHHDTSAEAHAERSAIMLSHFANATPVTGRKPVIYFMGGGGGAGKGTLKKQLQAEGKLPTDAVSIDSDEIKVAMKRFQAIKETGDYRAAATVHQDSSDVSKAVLSHAKQGNYDIIMDGTLADSEKTHARLEEFKKAGYDIKLYSVTANPDDALKRAFSRWEGSGRYVPMSTLRKAHKDFGAAVEGYETSPHVSEAHRYHNGAKMEHVHSIIEGVKQ
jgi:phage-related protein (TIGR01555 family)